MESEDAKCITNLIFRIGILPLFVVALLSFCLAPPLQAQSTVRLSPAASPAAGQPGVTVISVIGSGFPAGTISAAGVTVTLQPSSGGSAVTTAATTVATIIGTTRRVTFQIPNSVGVTSPTPYQVSISGSTSAGVAFQSSNTASLTVNPPAQIVSLTPNSGQPGQTLSITITAVYTNFLQGATEANFGPGVSVGGGAEGALGPVTVTSPTTATAQIVIDPSAASGFRKVSAQTGLQVASLAGSSSFSVASAPACIPAPPGMIGWWPADGNFNDIIGGNNGTPVNNVIFASGEVEQAFSLNEPGPVVDTYNCPSCAYVAISNHLPPSANAVTVDAWIYPDQTQLSQGSIQWIYAQLGQIGGPPGTSGPQLGISGAGSIYWRPNEDGAATSGFGVFDIPGIISPNRWTFIAGTYDASAGLFQLYVNGKLVGTKPQSGAVQLSSPAFIGSRFTPAQQEGFFVGRIDEVEVFARALSASEIQAVYNAGSGGKCKFAGTPALLSVSPSTGQQGQANLSAAITGQNTHFVQGMTTASFGSGITVASLTVNSPTSATAVLSIDSAATLGPRTVILTTESESATLNNGFTVTAASTGLPALVSLVPNSGQQGQQNLSVTITGQNTHFVQGTTVAAFGTGITVASLAVISPTSATAVMNIDPSATTGPRTVSLTTGSEVATLANGFTVTVLPVVPSITTISPNSAQQGQNGPVTIVGQNTHFVQGVTQVHLGAGITVTGITVTCPTCLSAHLAIAPDAPTGPHTVTVTSGAEVAILANGFTVQPGTPILTSVVPAQGQQGQTLSVAITGQFTHFAQGATQVSIGTGITVTGITVSSPTSLAAQIAINPTASPGARTLAVTTGTENVSVANVFTIQPGTPALVGANPNTGQQGQQNLPVTITGQFTHFAQGSSSVSFGGVIPVASITVSSPTTITADINIPANTPAGPTAVTVTTGAEVVSLNNAFTVTAGTPVTLSANPNSGQQGQQNLLVTVTGQFTHFAQGATQASFGADITVASLTVNSATSATAILDIDPAAAAGPRTVTLTTGTEAATLLNGFTVTPGTPGILSAAPNTGQQGQQNLAVVLTGGFTTWVQSTTTASFGAGISVASLTVNSPTSATAVVNIDPAAAAGARTIMLTTGTDVQNFNNGFTVTAASPVLLSVNPKRGQQGQNLSVTITGEFTHFAQGSTLVSFGAGITVSSVTVASPTSLGAQIQVPATAPTGPTSVTVTTGAEVAALNNGFTVTLATQTPTILSAVPNAGQQGQSALPVSITGQNTHFSQGVTQVSFGSGITVSSVAVTSPTSLTALINIDPSAVIGARTITAVTGSETASLTGGFTVSQATQGPSIIALSPNSGIQGNTLTAIITGSNTHFVQGTTRARFGPGVMVGAGIVGDFGPVTVSSETTATAQLTILGSALPGFRTVIVETNTEQAGLANGFQVTGAPTILGISPDSGGQGHTVAVAIAGAFTNWLQGATKASFGPGVSVNGGPDGGFGSLTVINAANATATLTIDGSATLGPRTVTVETGAEQASAGNAFSVLGPITGGPPVVAITSPAEAAEVTGPITVTGTVTSPNLDTWTLDYQAPGQTGFTTFATGTTSAVSGPFDPSLLLNGNVTIRLSATDTSGQSAVPAIVTVVVTRNLKIGNFTVSFNDLTIPAAGLPIQVVRTYDSRNKSVGDFGVGWTLDLKTVSVSSNGALGSQWTGTVTGGAFGLPNYCIVPTLAHVVTVVLPDGTTYEFQPSLNPQCQQLSPPTTESVSFTPTGNTPPNAALSAPGGSQLLIDGNFPGVITLTDLDGSTFDPDQYQLTLPDGRVLQISRQVGLQTMTDLNGNMLTVSSGGITSSNGKNMTFTRDSDNRISTITDPAGNVLVYTYDSNGDLASFTDQAGDTSSYGYDSNHDLVTIKDPAGVQPITNTYDDQGRLVSHTDAFGNVISYVNDPNTKQEIVTDALNNVTVNEYDSDGNIVKVTDALGGVTSRTYDGHDNLTSETNALGKTTHYTYDANNNRLTETDPLGNTTSYTYNARNQVTSITDALNRQTVNAYDANGNLVSTKDTAGNTTSYTYNAAGQQTSITDPLNGVTQFEYDASGNLIKKTDALSNVTTYTYDANGNKLSETCTRTTTSGQHTLVTSYQYDKLNRLIQTTYPDNSTTQIQYNAIGKQSVTTDQLKRQTSYQYDLMGRLIQTTYPDGTAETNTYDADGNRIAGTDRANRKTAFTYDQLNRPTQITYPDHTSTTTTYDAIGEVAAVKDADGNTTQFQYDDSGHRTGILDALNHTTTFGYDAVGNQISMTDADSNTTQYEYDDLNRRTHVVYPDSTADVTAYDALGRTISKTDEADRTTQFKYDLLGHLTQVTDALGQDTKYAYDEVGNRISQTDANGHTTTFAYDDLDRRTQRILPAGQSETFTYDAAGNLKTHTDFNGKTTTYAYDDSNRLTSKTPDSSFGAPAVSFTYTATGQRASMTDASGTTAYSYDFRDHLLQKATPEGTLTYTYDPAGNLTSIKSSNAGGTSVGYSYDQLNRLATVTDAHTGTTTYAYDKVGNLQSYLYPNGVATAYTYNPLNRLTSMTVGSLASYVYTLGPAGNRTAVSETGRQVNYTYDDLYRLTGETITGSPVPADNGAIGYQYDPVGNRLQRTSTLAAVPPSVYSYDQDDRLTTDSYDTSGNTISSGGHSYTYDFENHLISADGGAVRIVYDGDGNRVAETAKGVTTEYLVDDRNLTGYAQVLEELSGSAVQRVYTYGLSRIAETQSSGISFYGYDGHGNVRLLTNTAGGVTDRYDYDAFGNLISQAGSTPNVYRYSGEQLDPNVSLYYLRARYFTPNEGRFWTVDPASTFGTSRYSYAYADSNPVNRHDPSGLLTVAELSVSITINDILLSYETRVLAPTLFQSVQCAECVIAPATQMYNMGLTALSNGAGPWAQNLVWHGQSELVQGYRALGGIIANNYFSFFKALVTDSVQVKTDFSLPFINVIYDELKATFPAANLAGRGLTSAKNALDKISSYTEGVAEAYGYWRTNPHSDCGKAMIFGALGADIMDHMPMFDSPTSLDSYSYTLDGLTDDQYKQMVHSAIQQIKGQ